MARIKEGDLKQRALVLAESCHFEKEHSLQVARLSLSLFDQLALLHGLGEAEKALLEVAAILHDIGWMSGQKKHHKVALRIIVSSDKLLLEKQQRVIVGLVARYHRKSLPKMSHRFFSELDPSTRAKVKKLAALLRAADGLDRSHMSLVKSLTCRITPKQLILRIRSQKAPCAREDMDVAMAKSDLLRNVFKRQVRIVMEGEGRSIPGRQPGQRRLG